MGLLFRPSLKRQRRQKRRGKKDERRRKRRRRRRTRNEVEGTKGREEEELVLTECSLHVKHFAWIILVSHLNNLMMGALIFPRFSNEKLRPREDR